MNYVEILEKLCLSDKIPENKDFLMQTFNYHPNYEVLNLAIIEKAKNEETHISFDFIDTDMKGFKEKSISEVEYNYRRIYPLSGGNALMNTFNYPKYLAARGFKFEIRAAQKNHGYQSKSYYISWE